MNYRHAELDAMEGTSLKTYIEATYKELVAVLGQPYEGDGYKVSGEWVMRDPDSNVVTIYDWKSTRLYDPDYPTVRQFRAMKYEQRFNIGGHDSIAAENFRHWLALSLINLRQKNRKVG